MTHDPPGRSPRPTVHDSPAPLEATGELGRAAAAPARRWVTLAEAGTADRADRSLSGRRVVAQLVLGVLAVLVLVTGGGALASQRLAEREAVNDAANIADTLAEAVVQPVLSDALVAGDEAAVDAFDAVVRERVMSDRVVRLKLWTRGGDVIYADETELIGQTFPLEAEQLDVLEKPRTVAEVSDLSRSENTLDRQISSKLVEVYRPVWTPSGEEVLFEIYAPYDEVSQRTNQLWRGFTGISVTSLLLFLLLVSPIVWHLLSRVRRDQQQREHLLRRAVDAGADERRRIAANLHDGPVQELAASSFVVAGSLARAETAGQAALASELRTVSGTVRTSIRALRTLLVDIYPASLSRAGLTAALGDVAQAVRTDDFDVVLSVDARAVDALTPEGERLVYRVAQETLRNAAQHASPGRVRLAIRLEPRDEAVVLDVTDDGPGFDVEATVNDPELGHFGLQVLADAARDAGASLRVSSAAGLGTSWVLSVPCRPTGTR